jgi:hypothetical protein
VRVKKEIKKERQPASIRYLLYADRTLRRLSLRKISAPVQKGTKAQRSARSRRPTRAKTITRLPRAAAPWVTGIICVTAAAGLIAARGRSHPEEVTAVDAPRYVAAPPEPAARPVQVLTALAKPAAVQAKAPVAAPAVARTKTNVQTVPPVAISGCLERDHEAFLLKKTSGADAPKSRSWKSVFLKKRPVPIELVDASRTLDLERYVGQRVVATGTLTDREMQAHTVQRVAANCS